MPVTLQAGGTVQVGTTSLTVTGQPSGLLAGDILILAVFNRTNAAPATPAGWSADGGRATATAGYLKWFWRRVGVGETSQANVTITGLTSCSAGSMTVWRGAQATGTPFVLRNTADTYTLTGSTGAEDLAPSLATGNTLTVPSVTDDAVYVMWAAENDCTYASWAIEGVAAAEIGENLTTTGNDCSLGHAWRRPNSTNEVIDNASVVLTEASVGTSASVMLIVALLSAPAASAGSLVSPRSREVGEPNRGLTLRPRRRRAGA